MQQTPNEVLIDKLMSSLPNVGGREYKFIRTNGGEVFDNFVDNNYVSIGWNKITIADIMTLPEQQVKDKIRKNYYEQSEDYTETGKTRQASLAFGKLDKFAKMERGDVVVVPSYNSDRLAFGVVADDGAFNASTEELTEDGFIKRRKVIWKKIQDIESLDTIFWMVKSNMHSLSSINKYAEYIDSVMDEVYVKDDKIHQIINIKLDDDINFAELTELFTLHKEILYLINDEFNLGEEDEIRGTNVKLSLHSPGIVDLFQDKGQQLRKGRAAAIFSFY